MIEEIYKTYDNGAFYYVIEDWYHRGYPKGNYLCINLSCPIDQRGIYPAVFYHNIEVRYNVNPYDIRCTLQVMSEGMLKPIEGGMNTARFLWPQVLKIKIQHPYLFE